eukprot:14880120-Alexandrium_andersonii.AAC.1
MCTRRCRPRSPSPACALNPCPRGVYAGLARRHHAGEPSTWRLLESVGFARGKAGACCFYRPGRK